MPGSCVDVNTKMSSRKDTRRREIAEDAAFFVGIAFHRDDVNSHGRLSRNAVTDG